MRRTKLTLSTLGLLLLASFGWACAGGEPVDRGPEDGTHVVRDATLTVSTRPGMGAIPYDGGVTFRVWAPRATAVWVTGEFNGWGRTELGNEHNGNFSTDVPYAVPYQHYKFVIRSPWGDDEYRNDPRARRVTNSTGDSVIHDPASYWWSTQGFATPPWNEQVIYELHLGTFHVPYGQSSSTWLTAVDKLDYLRDLGINMIEVLPVAEFPGDYSIGFNPAFPFAPESAYGTPDDMKYFIDQAHARGIGVIFDVVHNHWGPNDLPMWCFSGDCLGAGGEYFYTDWRADTPWGKTRPDYGRAEVRDYIRDNMRMYLDEYHADGLRWDATHYIRSVDGETDTWINEGWDLLRSMMDEVDAKWPWKIMIAEDFRGDLITTSTGNGGGGFDAQWAGEFVHPIRDAVVGMNDGDRNLYAVRDAIVQRFNGYAFQRVIYTESHDEDANGHQRLPEEIWPGNSGNWAARKRSTLAASVMMTSPGIPMLFQGQEFVEDGWFSAERALDWSKAGTFAGITQLYRDLVRLRRNWQNNTRGLLGGEVNVYHVNNTGKVIAYHRWKNGGPGDDVVVIANFSAQWFPAYHVGLPRGGLWYVRFNSDWNGYSPDFGNTASLDTYADQGPADGLGYSGTIELGPYSAVILSQ